MHVDFGTGFAGAVWRCRDMEVATAAPMVSQDTITGIASWIPTLHASAHISHFSMSTGFRRASTARASSISANSNLTPTEAESRLLRSSTEDVVTHSAANIDNVKSKIHSVNGQDHHHSTTIDPWTLACVLIDLTSWVMLNRPWISQILILCSNMEQSLTLEATLPAPPPPPPQKPRQWKEPSPEPQQAVIPRSWPSSLVPLSSQHQHHNQ